MIPRYQNNLSIHDWINFFSFDLGKNKLTNSEEINFLKTLNPFKNFPYSLPFEKARFALYSYFEHLAKTVGTGKVLISAQICPIVPCILDYLGFTICFIDIDDSYPHPSPSQFLQEIDENTIAIIISPLYGYIQKDWESILEQSSQIKLVLDLAQGIGLEKYLENLYKKSDAVVYSFGIGKGLDTGGGLLLTKQKINFSSIESKSYQLDYFKNLMQNSILQLITMFNVYSFLSKKIDQEIESDKLFIINHSYRLFVNDKMYSLWHKKLLNFRNDIHKSQIRANELRNSISIKKTSDNLSVFFNSQAIHLRQIIKFKDVHLKEKVMKTLKKKRIECLPAGEALPQEYFNLSENKIFPNAKAFQKYSIRLPFLGRLSENQFSYLKETLENAIIEYLSP